MVATGSRRDEGRAGVLPVRGVNLGNWLVLEKWMGGSPLSVAQAEDDRAWIDEVEDTERARALGEHYRSYVTQDTFAWLAQMGVELVRIPVPYHLFGSAHHVACVGYLDDAFAWAERFGLKVLVDLHTVPKSQNGFDNGGYTALCAWSRSRRRMRKTVDLLERIASRYAGRDALWGIEPLNEPVSKRVYLANYRKNRHHPRRIMRSWPVSRRRLVWFYRQVYERVRPVVRPEVRLVFHDHFSLRGWERFDPGHGDDNVWIDTHQYMGFADAGLMRFDAAEYLELVERMAAPVQQAAAYHPILVGEWCLANHASKPTSEFYRTFAAAQLAAWDQVGGSCFWSLRVQKPGFDNWSFETCVNRGWLDYLHM